MTFRLELIPLRAFPLVEPGDDLGQLIRAALQANDLSLQPGDVIVVAQKVVSKAEDRYVRLADVKVSPEAQAIAEQAEKDPRQVQLILEQSNDVVRVRPGVIIVEHILGFVHANAGIDKSNILNDVDDPRVLLLPEDPDGSARALCRSVGVGLDVAPLVIINDCLGRAWRNGTVGLAIGCAGLAPVHNQIGQTDLFGNILEVTEPAVADELAAAASLVMGQAAEACPVVLARGANLARSDEGSGALLRAKSTDMCRGWKCHCPTCWPCPVE
jgi:coenzyme F420-0:L-glutamate ligase/coenzyme F420-1:gamma-L-glutamate ligase